MLPRVYDVDDVEHFVAILHVSLVLVRENDARQLIVSYLYLMCTYITKFIIYRVYLQNSVYTDTWFEIWAMTVWGPTGYLSVTEPHINFK